MKGYIIMVECPTGDKYDIYTDEYSGIIHTSKREAEAELRKAKKDQFVYEAYMEVLED